MALKKFSLRQLPASFQFLMELLTILVLDLVTNLIGKEKRWKTKPWIVVIFGIAVGPLGFVSILLVILQPVLLHSWCTLCLTSAAISIVMISPAMDELLASLQYLKRVKKRGGSAWKAFWGKEVLLEKNK